MSGYTGHNVIGVNISAVRDVLKAFALWLGLTALMVQAVAPLCAPGLTGGTSGNASMVICTAHGFETVQLGSDGKPVPVKPAHIAQDCCSACPAAGGFIASASVPVTIPSRVAYEDIRFFAASFLAPRLYVSYVTRGPPAAMSRDLA